MGDGYVCRLLLNGQPQFVELAGQEIRFLALTFVSPLSADYHQCRHSCITSDSSWRLTFLALPLSRPRSSPALSICSDCTRCDHTRNRGLRKTSCHAGAVPGGIEVFQLSFQVWPDLGPGGIELNLDSVKQSMF